MASPASKEPGALAALSEPRITPTMNPITPRISPSRKRSRKAAPKTRAGSGRPAPSGGLIRRIGHQLNSFLDCPRMSAGPNASSHRVYPSADGRQ